MTAPLFDPFNMTDSELTAMAGEMTPDEMRCVKAVLNGVKAKMHQVNMNSGMTHGYNCWAWGPAHYMCAHNTIMAMIRDRPQMPHGNIAELAEDFDMPYEDAEAFVRNVEDYIHRGIF